MHIKKSMNTTYAEFDSIKHDYCCYMFCFLKSIQWPSGLMSFDPPKDPLITGLRLTFNISVGVTSVSILHVFGI